MCRDRRGETSLQRADRRYADGQLYRPMFSHLSPKSARRTCNHPPISLPSSRTTLARDLWGGLARLSRLRAISCQTRTGRPRSEASEESESFSVHKVLHGGILGDHNKRLDHLYPREE